MMQKMHHEEYPEDVLLNSNVYFSLLYFLAGYVVVLHQYLKVHIANPQQVLDAGLRIRIRIRSDPECFARIRIRNYHSGSGSDQYEN